VILEEYTNGEEIHINYNVSIKLLLLKVDLTRLGTTYCHLC
jgi:hypothetical protein